MHDSSQTHREIVAAVASLKSCLRSVIIAVSPPAANTATHPDSKIQGSVQRANDAVGKLEGLLSAVADQTLRLPLETSKRLVDVGLPDLLQQLLNACQLAAAWPAPAQAASAAATSSADGSVAVPPSEADTEEAAATAATAPAALHPSWASVQQLLQAVFSTLAVLTSVLIRACTRSHEPAMVLMQLASSDVMAAQVTYLQQLRQHAAQLRSSAGSETADPLAAQSIECAPACVAAFTSIYGLLAAATDAQTGLEELRQQLVSSLCSTQLLPVAAELLLLVPVTMQPEQQQAHQVQVDCQAAGWSLLTLALFTSGAGISICPADMNPACIRPGQPVPSSLMAASIRADAAGQPQPQPLDLAAAFSAAAEPSAATLQEQLLSQPVLSLLQERLYHCVTELRGSYGASSTALAQQQKLLAQVGAPSQLLLLPGRCCPADQDVLHAVLRALRVWRALLTGPAAPSLPLSTNYGVHLLLTLLAGVLAEPIRAGSSEREALRGRVIRVAVHCLQLMCSCLSHELLTQQLPALTAALAGVVGTAGAYWDSNRRAVKSEALPYTGQVRCVDKVTGDMMVRYTMAAQSALELLKQLLSTCRAYGGTPLGNSHAGGVRVAQVMLSAGVLPALEQLFRQLPVVSPAHVTAMLLLVELLPLCMTAELSSGQLPLLVTLRKFTVKSVGIPEPDREASMITATQLAALLGTMACVYASSHTTPGGPADTLMQHAAVQLLPALQAYVSAVLKTPIPAPYSLTVSNCSVAATAAALSSSGAATELARAHLLPYVLHMYQQLASLGSAVPHLQLGPALLCAQALPTVTDILSSNYWLLPGFQAAAGLATGRLSPAGAPAASRSSSVSEGGSSGSMFTGKYAVRTALMMLDSLVTCQAAGSGLALQNETAGNSGMHGSCSSDCLCAMKRTEGSDSCQIGNAKCGMHGWCCCGSPKASSDITAPVTHAVTQASGAVLPGQQQLLLVLARLMQTRLLPELLRVVTQLPGPAGVDIPASKATSPKPVGSTLGAFNRPGSASGLTVNVPARRSTLQRDHKGGVSPGGVSPKVYSPLGHSAPSGVMLASSLHSQASATQSFLTAYMGEMPSTALGSNSSSSSSTAHPVANGFRVTAASTSRFASAGSAATGTSPRHADDGAYGLLRAGSSGSNFDWGAGVTSSALLQEAGVKVAVRDSSGYGSSPSLASLASPHALSSGADNMSPFLTTQRDGTSAAAAGSTAPGAAADSAGSHLQVKLEALLLAVAQHTLALADAGLLGPELLQRRPSGISAGGDSDSGTAGATPVEGSTPSGLPKPALFGTASGNVWWLSASGAGGVSRHLSSVASGPASLYSSYLQSSSGPRGSFSGSGHFGAMTAEDVLAGIRSSLAAAGASAVVRPDAAAPSDAGAFAVGAKDLVAVGGSPIGAQHEAIPVGQQVMGEGAPSRQGSSPGPGSGGSPGGHSASLAFEASKSDIMFPVELGFSQLAISTRAGPAEAASMGTQAPLAAAPAAPPGTPATPAGFGNWPAAGSGAGAAAAAAAAAAPPQQLGLSVDILRRLQGSLSAAAPLLARHSGVIEPEVLCPQVMLARLAPQPVGCWNPSCTNMPGVSEATVPSKPCNSCKVASFCSKACEKMAWSEHTMACSRLAALAAAAASAASGEVAV